MPRLSLLFEAADDVLDAHREALRQRDLDSMLSLWTDDDSISCVLAGGTRVVGHDQLRESFAKLFETQALLMDPLETTIHVLSGTTLIETTEALRVDANATEADMYLHVTYVLLHTHEGWRLLHLHSSEASLSALVLPQKHPQALH